MLISVCTNAVMFRVNVQNVLRRLQLRLSVARDSSSTRWRSSATSVIRWCL